jgi:hypothetical protein
VAVRLASPLVVLAILAAIAGCGGEETPAPDAPSRPTEQAGSPASGYGAGQPAGDDDEQQVTEPDEDPFTVEQVVEAVLTGSGTVEQGCSTLVGEEFVRDAYGDVSGCEAARRGAAALARRVSFVKVTESGATASATVIPTGGPYDGVEVEVELVADPEHEGAWLVASLFADVPAGP